MEKCRACSGEVVEVLDLGYVRLNEFRTDNVIPDAYPLSLDMCLTCSLIQLGTSVDPNLIYTDAYGFESGVNNTVCADLASIVEAATSLVELKDYDIVIDIGCNDGTLLSNYSEKIIRVGVDPVEKFADKAMMFANYVVSDFFNAEAVRKIMKHYIAKAKIITSISMFYDLEDPSKFCEDISEMLDDNGVWVVQQNYLGSMLTQNAYDNIVHQHVEYYSMHSMMSLLERFDLRIFRVEENNINGGSFRTFICKDDAIFINEPSVNDLLEKEKEQGLNDVKTFYDFGVRIFDLTTTLHNLITELNFNKKTVYIYGASTRGDTLLQLSGLNNTLLPYAVERNPDKFGKKIASLQIPIISEEEARRRKPDYMLVLPWFFFDEFKHRENDYLEDGGRFILPLPQVGIVGIGPVGAGEL